MTIRLKPQPYLLPLAVPYQAAVRFRNRLYDLRVLPIEQVESPVVSVGNLSVGGTGKTPFVIFLAWRIRELTLGRVKPAVVSRGYGRSTRGGLVVSAGRGSPAEEPDAAGDEPVLIARSLPGVPVLVDRDRVRAARRAVAEFGAKVVLLDDGFQYRRLARDLDIVLLDASDPLGNRLTLPAGPLREPVGSLSRADLVVLSKAVECDDELQRRAHRLSNLLKKPVVVARLAPLYWRHIGGRELFASDQVSGRRVFAFAGIAAPGSFLASVRALGAQIVDHLELPDHCRYTKSVLDRVAAGFTKSGAEWLVTTAKDAVKLPAITRYLPLFYLDSRVEIAVGGEELDAALLRMVEEPQNSKSRP